MKKNRIILLLLCACRCVCVCACVGVVCTTMYYSITASSFVLIFFYYAEVVADTTGVCVCVCAYVLHTLFERIITNNNNNNKINETLTQTRHIEYHHIGVDAFLCVVVFLFIRIKKKALIMWLPSICCMLRKFKIYMCLASVHGRHFVD